uniref:Transthyretin-like protein n=1 Tax=Xiphinema index TaxID=46003 RepID=Q5TIX4_9BILA|nr:transthyretin-like protein [Xiphinema index]
MEKAVLVVCVFFCLLPVTLSSLGQRQRVIVKGRLLCGNAPASNIRVKLVDEDDGPDPDDDMDDGYTNDNGEFLLDGQQTEISPIDPVLKIYHDCNDGLPCQRKWRFKIPNKYIVDPEDSSTVMNMGTWNLEPIADDEERDCIH